MSTNYSSTAQELAANVLLAVMFLILFSVAVHVAFNSDESTAKTPCITEEPGR